MNVDIDEADQVHVRDSVAVVDVGVVRSDGAATACRPLRHGVDTTRRDQSTQTPGHVILGEEGEVIITTNYARVKLLFSEQAVQRLMDSSSDMDTVTDLVTTTLARLDWNGERILERGLTSCRLTLREDLMRRLIEEVADMVQREPNAHHVQRLAQDLMERYQHKLFGLDLSSLVFLVEHCSVEDAEMTLRDTHRQRQLQQAFLAFLPQWVYPFAVWTVDRYRLTAADLSSSFGLLDVREVMFVASLEPLPQTTATGADGERLASGSQPSHGTENTCSDEAMESGEVAESEQQEPVSKFPLLQAVDTDSFPTEEVDLRLVVLGKTGSGKSSSANTILGQDVFPAGVSFSSLTKVCSLQTAARDGITLQVMDSPGLFDTALDQQTVSRAVMAAVASLEEGPDAILYVIKIGSYTEEEFAVYNTLKALLDENITRFLIVIFTHGDQLGSRAFEDMLPQIPSSLQQVLNECENRYLVFDNVTAEKGPLASRLLCMVQQLQQRNEGRRYRCPRYAETLDQMDWELERRLEAAEQRRQEKSGYIQKLNTQLQQAEETLSRQREELERQEQAWQQAESDRNAAMLQEIANVSDSLKQQSMTAQEQQSQIEYLRAQLQSGEERIRQEQQQQRQRLAEQLKEKEELFQQEVSRLTADIQKARQSAQDIVDREMQELMQESVRSARRRRNGCSVM